MTPLDPVLPSFAFRKLAITAGLDMPSYKSGIANGLANMLASPARTLYLVAYDISDPKRLARVHRYVLGWKVGGQKSFYECWLTKAELALVMEQLGELIDPLEDRIHVFQLDARMPPKCFGVATTSGASTPILIL